MGRTPCCDKNGLKKGPWTPEEDQKLIDYIQKHGYGNWRTLPKNAGLQRCGKSCRLRWTNYLRPDIKRGRFSFEEEETIIQLHSILGNKWSAIAARLPGRTDNEIKNYWNTHIRKRLLRMGIDPVTHSPRLDLLDLPTIFHNTPSLLNTCSPPPQMNMSRLLPLVNPEIIKLANSLMSSSTSQPQNNHFSNSYTHNFSMQKNNIDNPIMQNSNSNQIQEPIPNCTTMTTTSSRPPCLPFSSDPRLINPNLDQYQDNILNFYEQNLDQWQTSNNLVNIDQLSINYYDINNNNHAFGDPSSSLDNNGHQNSIKFAPSIISTPSNSNSNSNSTNVYSNITEDERDQSYCSDMIKFEIPDYVDVNQLLLSSQDYMLMKGS